MTLSSLKIHTVFLFLLVSSTVWAAEPPTAELSAAQTAIIQAERLSPRGTSAQSLQSAKMQLAEAQALNDKRKYKDAASAAYRAQVTAELAKAQAELANARMAVDEKAARNADLRRQLLVNTER
jgi:predicted S18 family serine protease